MNVQKIVTKLKKKYPNKTIVQNKNDNGVVTEILCEIEPTSRHPEWSNAVAVLDKSTKHYHSETTETYKVLKGTLNLFVDGEKIILNKGDTYTIPPNKVHFATGDETWLECRSEPGWKLEDYILKQDQITPLKKKTPLKSLLWENDSKNIFIIVGGSGDDRFKMKPWVKKLIGNGMKHNILTFSFKGVEENGSQPLKNQIDDLESILQWAIKNYDGKIDIACTSDGAYSTTHALINRKISKKIHTAIFVDPADYQISKNTKEEIGGTWSGLDEYKPEGITLSSLLNQINTDAKVYVINLLLRNFTENGYVSEDKRHIDNPKCFTRLNNSMVKSFYKNTPKKNKGKYIKDTKLPHAFIRDGNIERNVKRLASLIMKLLTQ